MTNLDLIIMALKNLAKRKLRTALTILSVVIGASSIIIMVSLGVALSENFDKQINEMGGITTITVNANYGGKNITTDNINKFKGLEGVEAVTPIIEDNIKILLNGGRDVAMIRVMALDPATMEALGYKTLEGRALDAQDVGSYNMVINPLVQYSFYKKGKAEPYPMWIYSEDELLPDAVQYELLNQKATITTDLDYGVKRQYINNSGEKKAKAHKTFKVNFVGIVDKMQKYSDNYVFMSLDTFEKFKKEMNRINGSGGNNAITISGGGGNKEKGGYQKALIKCKDLDMVEKVMKEITDIGEFQSYSEAEYINATKKMNAGIQLLLGAIGGISLFIAAIGITNTMVMSIYERTKEIGIMKVIGAKVSDIKRLFLLEAILIGFLGGAIGVTFSLTVSIIINKFAGSFMSNAGMELGDVIPKVSSIPIWLALFALVFTSFIGLIAGYLPAKKAVKIEALKAIKTE